jgi:hypothetical protein
MRHYGTLIAAVVISPLAWILIAFGQDRSAQAFANANSNGAFDTADFLRPLVFLAAAGLLLGLIGTLRFSPLGAVFAGVVYAGSYLLLLIAPKGLMNFIGHNLSVAGHRADMSLPLRTGTALVLGAVLLVAVASVSRWRRWPRPVDATPNAFDDIAPLLPEYRSFGGTDPGPGLPDRDTERDLLAHPSGAGQLTAGAVGSHWAASLRSGQDDSRW